MNSTSDRRPAQPGGLNHASARPVSPGPRAPRGLQLSGLLVGLLLAAPAQAAPASPAAALAWVKSKVTEGEALVRRPVKAGTPEAEAMKADVKARLEALLDWQTLTQRSLGRRWDKLTPAQKKEFRELLREMIEASYTDKLQAVTPKKVKKAKSTPLKITWGDPTAKKGGVDVEATVKRGKTEAQLRFSLLPAGKAWKVWDVAIDEVSTVRTYRSQFRRIITKEGVDGLLKRMRSKIEDIKAGRAGTVR